MTLIEELEAYTKKENEYGRLSADETWTEVLKLGFAGMRMHALVVAEDLQAIIDKHKGEE